MGGDGGRGTYSCRLLFVEVIGTISTCLSTKDRIYFIPGLINILFYCTLNCKFRVFILNFKEEDFESKTEKYKSRLMSKFYGNKYRYMHSHLEEYNCKDFSSPKK